MCPQNIINISSLYGNKPLVTWSPAIKLFVLVSSTKWPKIAQNIQIECNLYRLCSTQKLCLRSNLKAILLFKRISAYLASWSLLNQSKSLRRPKKLFLSIEWSKTKFRKKVHISLVECSWEISIPCSTGIRKRSSLVSISIAKIKLQLRVLKKLINLKEKKIKF